MQTRLTNSIDQFILFPQSDGRKSFFPHISIICNWSFLYNSVFCSHKEIVIILIFPNRNHRRDLFARLKHQKIDNGRSSCPSTLGFVARITSLTCPSIRRDNNSFIFISSGPIPFIGDIEPCNT